jgi:hypothetical protein
MALAISACSDRFLYETPQIVEISTDTIFIEPRQSIDSTITITTNSGSNSTYKIFQYPNFFTLDTMGGQLSQGATNITFHTTQMIEYFYSTKQWNGQLIIDVDGYGLVAYSVQIKLPKEKPVIHDIEFSSLDINIGEADSVVLSITNKCPAPTSWAIYNKPDWLSVVSTWGSIESGQTASLVFKVNRIWLQAGNYRGTMDINFNSCQSFLQTISFSMDVVNVLDNPSKYNIQLLDGDVIAADFVKEKNELLVLTSSPNRLTCINLDNKSQSVIELSKKPTCMAVSENGEMALIGYTFAELSSINLIEHKINRLFDLPFIPFDVEFGENGWCYVSSKDEFWGSNIINMELTTGNIVRKNAYFSIQTQSKLIKIPNQKKILALTMYYNPSRPRIGNISADTLTSEFYEYTDFDTYYDFWFIKNGSMGISRNKEIFKFQYELPEEKQMKRYGSILEHGLELNFLNENTEKNEAALCVFNYLGANSCVSIFNTDSFEEKKKIYPKEVLNYNLKPYYAFFNKAGDKLVMIVRRHTDREYIYYWHIETRILN